MLGLNMGTVECSIVELQSYSSIDHGRQGRLTPLSLGWLPTLWTLSVSDISNDCDYFRFFFFSFILFMVVVICSIFMFVLCL